MNGALDNNTIILSTVGLLFVTWYVSRMWLRRKFPPGLPSVPILGSLPWLSGKVNHLTFYELSRKYGNIYTINFGRQHAVVLNDHRSIQEALIAQGEAFADRPTYYNSMKNNPKQKGFVIAHYDSTFIRSKKVSLAILRDLGFGRKLMEERILSEVNELLELLNQHKGRPYDPRELLYISVSNIMCLALFGKRFAFDDVRFLRTLQAVRDVVRQSGELMLVEFLPLIRFLPWARRGKKASKEYITIVHNFIKEELKEHSKLLGQNDYQGDFISSYTHTMAESLDQELLFRIPSDFFIAGSDTSSTTLRWALIYMANNPDIQSRAQGEIDDVIGPGRPPSMSDRCRLGYVEAIIVETLRMSSIVPLGIPHQLSIDTTLQDFHLKAGTVVYTNLWAANHDPDVWPEPHKFNPDRFLDDKAEVVNREKVIAFGLGRRSCLGETLARQELFLYLTSLLQRFEVLPPPGQDKLPEEAVFGTVLSPQPHKVVLRPR